MSNLSISSASAPRFKNPSHFQQVGRKWICTICSPNRRISPLELNAALRHEATSPHTDRALEADWSRPAASSWSDPPVLYTLQLDGTAHRRKKGKSSKPWLQSAEHNDESLNTPDAWPDYEGPGPDGARARVKQWIASIQACGGAGEVPEYIESARSAGVVASQERRKRESPHRDPAFVESYARKKGADPQSVARMQQFFALSTDQKVHKIQQLIYSVANLP